MLPPPFFLLSLTTYPNYRVTQAYTVRPSKTIYINMSASIHGLGSHVGHQYHYQYRIQWYNTEHYHGNKNSSCTYNSHIIKNIDIQVHTCSVLIFSAITLKNKTGWGILLNPHYGHCTIKLLTPNQYLTIHHNIHMSLQTTHIHG